MTPNRMGVNRIYRVIDKCIAAVMFSWQLFWTSLGVFNRGPDLTDIFLTILVLTLFVCWFMGKKWVMVPLIVLAGVCSLALIPLAFGMLSNPPGIEHSTQNLIAVGFSTLSIPLTMYLIFRIRTWK